jgi:hypothetical protein
MERKKYAQLRTEIEDALKGIAEKYEMEIKAGSMNYTDNSFSLKIEGHVKLVEGGKAYEQEQWNRHCKYYGFEEQDYGKEFTSSGKTFVLTGFAIKSSKYPVLAKNKTNGTTFKFTEDVKRKIA